MSKKLLIVDDEPEIRDLMKMLFEGNGYEVFVAGSGKEAIAVVEREHPQMMLLDTWMPEMDGVQVLTRVRTIDKSIQVIMLSGEINPGLVQKTRELGACDYMAKGSSFQNLQTSVASRLLAMAA